MDRLYKYSISKKRYQIILFWTSIVLINALPGLIWGLFSFDLIGRLLGICTWLLIFLLIFSKIFQKLKNKVLKCAIYNSYKLKTFSIIFLIGFYLDLHLGIISSSISYDLMNILGFDVYYIGTLMWQTDYEILFSYLTTLIHGGILNILIGIFSIFLFGVFNLLIKFGSIRKEYYKNY